MVYIPIIRMHPKRFAQIREQALANIAKRRAHEALARRLKAMENDPECWTWYRSADDMFTSLQDTDAQGR